MNSNKLLVLDLSVSVGLFVGVTKCTPDRTMFTCTSVVVVLFFYFILVAWSHRQWCFHYRFLKETTPSLVQDKGSWIPVLFVGHGGCLFSTKLSSFSEETHCCSRNISPIFLSNLISLFHCYHSHEAKQRLKKKWVWWCMPWPHWDLCYSY